MLEIKFLKNWLIIIEDFTCFDTFCLLSVNITHLSKNLLFQIYKKSFLAFRFWKSLKNLSEKYSILFFKTIISAVQIYIRQKYTCSKSTIDIKNCELYSRLTVKTPERRQWRCFSVFIETIEHISHLFLVFLLFSLSMYFVAVSNVGETIKVWFSFVFMLVKLVMKWNQWFISSVIIVELEQLCFKSIVVKFLSLTMFFWFCFRGVLRTLLNICDGAFLGKRVYCFTIFSKNSLS